MRRGGRAQLRASAIGFGGSFLGTAAASAAGVIGGALLLNSISSMFGHRSGSAFADVPPAVGVGFALGRQRGRQRSRARRRPQRYRTRRRTRRRRAPGCSTCDDADDSDVADLGGDFGGGDGGGDSA